MNSAPDYFDVLSIEGNNEKVDIIQSLIGSDCLGTCFENGIAQLYFNGGNKDDIEFWSSIGEFLLNRFNLI